MDPSTLIRTGRVGWAGVLTIATMWVVGGWTSDQDLIVFSTRTGVVTSIWALLHGLLLLGSFISVALQRLPRRPGVVLGLMIALVSGLGIEIVRVIAVMHSGITNPMIPLVAVFVCFIGLAPTLLAVGAIGGWLGSLISARETSEFGIEPRVAAPEHLSPRFRELYDATQIARSTLEGGCGRLETMESTVAFSWVESLRALEEPEQDQLRWRGFEIGPLVDLVEGRGPQRMRPWLIQSMSQLIEGLRDDSARPCYR